MSEAPASTITVAGREPEAVYRPQSLEELRELVRGRDGVTLVPVGGGTQLGLGAAPQGRFAVVDVAQALSGAVEHAPEDLTAVIPAGVTLGAVNETLRASGQHLPLDPPNGPLTTLGGALAVGVGGPLRSRYGLPRDLVLGMTVLRADGDLVHAGVGTGIGGALGFALAKGLAHLVQNALISRGLRLPWNTSWAPALQFALAFLVIDFGRYWQHRWLHTSRFGWRLHLLHHDIEKLNTTKTARAHILERIVQQVCLFTPILSCSARSSTSALACRSMTRPNSTISAVSPASRKQGSGADALDASLAAIVMLAATGARERGETRHAGGKTSGLREPGAHNARVGGTTHTDNHVLH